MFFLLRMTIYNLTAAPSLMMADLHTVPCSSAVLYGQGASLHGCWALEQWENSGRVAVQENHIKEILSSLLNTLS